MKITRENVETLHRGQILHHVTVLNADKTPLRARVNGKVKLWKTSPEEFRVPMKYGIKTCFYITDLNAKDWIIPED